MDYQQFTQVHPVRKRWDGLRRGLLAVPLAVGAGFRLAMRRIAAGIGWIVRQGKGLVRAAREGDARTRLNFIVMGAGLFLRGQVGRGLLYLASQVAYVVYLVTLGWQYIQKIGTLGTTTQQKVFDEEQGIYIYQAGDNSMQILLFGVLTIGLTIVFAALYFHSIRTAIRAQRRQAMGGHLPTFREDMRSLLDKRYHITLLTPPVLLVLLFTLLPLIFMVLIAFTNFDKTHQPPGNLFTWVGWDNFTNMLGGNAQLGHTFLNLLLWTFVWAVFATFSNYLFGTILSLLINKKGIRFKKMWRTVFVVTIAVPQFVSLMLMSQVLADEGALNVLLRQWGWITESIPFLTNGTLAKITVIVVNMWIGIPYTMLITSGILMNIPEDMYESARIDGAGPVRMFFSITLPYMLFVTTPYLITQFVNNINNFNVIYLLTRGGPLTLEYFKAGKTDLLVTWLYKQTVEEQNYNLAGVIGVLVFIITAVCSLLVYNSSTSVKKEEEFQ